MSVRNKFATTTNSVVSSVEFCQSSFDERQIMGICQQRNVWLFVHFLNTHERPSLAACALSDVWETWKQQEELPNAREIGCSLITYFRFA